MYNNLIYFLIALFLFSTSPSGHEAHGSFLLTIGLVTFILGIYAVFCHLLFSKAHVRGGERYGFFLALLFFAIICLGSDLRFYLLYFSFRENVLFITDALGLAVFLCFPCILWASLASNTESTTRKQFVADQLRSNLPIVLPWGVFSLSQDLMGLIPSPSFQEFLTSNSGQILSIFIFVLTLLVILPPLIPKVWGCTPLPDDALSKDIKSFCAKLNFSAHYMHWPLLRGRAITAGVVGFFPKIRYILLTPAIIEYMDRRQLKAILAHEIGHVKHAHILLYLGLVVSFSLLLGFLAEPLIYALISSHSLILFTLQNNLEPDLVFTLASGFPLLVIVVLFFRYIFGYFIRNFERQADLFTIKPMQGAASLISAFDTIAILTGTEKKQSNWHHFGIGERIEALNQGVNNPNYITRHNRKVFVSLLLYFSLTIALCIYGVSITPDDPETLWKEAYAETVIAHKAETLPQDPQWQILLADLMIYRGKQSDGLELYAHNIEKFPNNTEMHNNFAWYLLTISDPTLRNPNMALSVAQKAVVLKRTPHALDTLATAYWAVGKRAQAISLEEEAMAIEPRSAEYYSRRIQLFQSYNYGDIEPIRPTQQQL